MTAAATSLALGLVLPRRRDLAALVGLAALQALPTLLAGAAVAHAVDQGFLAGRTPVGLAWLAAFGASALVGAGATRASYVRLGTVVEPVRDELVRRAVAGSLRRSARDRGPTDAGAVARVTDHAEVARDTLAGLLVAAIEFPVTTIAALVGLATLAPVVLWLVAPPLVAALALLVATARPLADRQYRVLVANEALAEDAARYLAGLRDVTACGGEAASAARLDRAVDAHVDAARRVAVLSAVRTGALGLGAWLPLALVVLAAPSLVRHGTTAGEVVGAVTYLTYGLHGAVGSLVNGLTGGGTRLAAALRRIVETSEAPAERPGGGTPGADAAPTDRAMAPAALAVAVRGLSFAYSRHSASVLRGLDLAVEAGGHLAVVGPSGIGKSTLAALLAGMLEPDVGEVLVGGVPAREVTPERRALIPQEAYTFAGTLGENLRYLCPDAPDAALDRAVAAVGLGALVERAGGYGADVRAAALTAGERQLVALARAWLSPAALVVLDEATCHLDAAAEATAERAFVDRGGTLVVVAHRISSALRADRVLVLDGAEARLGTHEALLRSSPLYRELVGYWDATTAVVPPAG